MRKIKTHALTVQDFFLTVQYFLRGILKNYLSRSDKQRLIYTLLGCLTCTVPSFVFANEPVHEPVHGISMHGKPQMTANFTHLPYANPNAPKGGILRYALTGKFDSLNPFITMGVAPRGLFDSQIGNNVFETLMFRSRDEPFALYGLIAQSVTMPEDRSWIEFTLNPEAKFSDGEPIGVDDVIFTFELLRDHGKPHYQRRHKKVVDVTQTGENKIKFVFANGEDRELPLLFAGMPVLPKHAIKIEAFDKPTLDTPIGSGPYLIESVTSGTRFLLKRNPEYWGNNLPINIGRNNFDRISIEYFRDGLSAQEAFKKGDVDFIAETSPEKWKTEYNFTAVQEGKVINQEFKTGLPKGMTGLVFNSRRDMFKDPKVREAITYLFDFEWANKNLFHGLFERSQSYFDGSELSALGQPASNYERELLQNYDGVVSPEVMEGQYTPPKSDGSGKDRKNMRQALKLFKQAGWSIKDRKLINAQGKQFEFEILLFDQSDTQVLLTFQRALELLGASVKLQIVDSSQFWDRIRTFDFDMIKWRYTASLSPGVEQINRWSPKNIEREGTFTFAGAQEPAIDAMIEAMLAATDREKFVKATRALDRVLISGHYVIPLYHASGQWLSRWKHIGVPDRTSLFGYQPTAFWYIGE